MPRVDRRNLRRGLAQQDVMSVHQHCSLGLLLGRVMPHDKGPDPAGNMGAMPSAGSGAQDNRRRGRASRWVYKQP
jgi:hypothetical protein